MPLKGVTYLVDLTSAFHSFHCRKRAARWWSALYNEEDKQIAQEKTECISLVLAATGAKRRWLIDEAMTNDCLAVVSNYDACRIFTTPVKEHFDLK